MTALAGSASTSSRSRPGGVRMSMALAGVALCSVRRRWASATATLVSVALAELLIGSFATLLESASGADGGDRETLVVMGAVVGSWGAIIALFSLASTVGVTVRQRAGEIGLVRTIGATPAQARRLFRAETGVVALVGVIVGSAGAWLAGRGLLALLVGSGLIDDVAFTGGPRSLGITAAGLFVIAMVASEFAGRRATNGPAQLTLVDARVEAGSPGRFRVVAGVLLVAYGVTAGVLTVTVMAGSDDPYAPMQTAGSAAIVVGVGLACHAPWLLAIGARLGRPLLGRSAPAHLAGTNAVQRAGVLGPVLGPVIVFTAATVGVVLLAGIDGRTLSALVSDQQEAATITLLNYVVTAMIAVFAAIMMLNALVAVTMTRSGEFADLRLAGATVAQVRRSVVLEAWLVAAIGIGFGLVASLATVVPYSVVRDEGIIPDGQLWVPVAVAAAAVILSGATASIAAQRALAS